MRRDTLSAAPEYAVAVQTETVNTVAMANKGMPLCITIYYCWNESLVHVSSFMRIAFRCLRLGWAILKLPDGLLEKGIKTTVDCNNVILGMFGKANDILIPKYASVPQHSLRRVKEGKMPEEGRSTPKPHIHFPCQIIAP